jgi:hypothetical protein
MLNSVYICVSLLCLYGVIPLIHFTKNASTLRFYFIIIYYYHFNIDGFKQKL